MIRHIDLKCDGISFYKQRMLLAKYHRMVIVPVLGLIHVCCSIQQFQNCIDCTNMSLSNMFFVAIFRKLSGQLFLKTWLQNQNDSRIYENLLHGYEMSRNFDLTIK